MKVTAKSFVTFSVLWFCRFASKWYQVWVEALLSRKVQSSIFWTGKTVPSLGTYDFFSSHCKFSGIKLILLPANASTEWLFGFLFWFSYVLQQTNTTQVIQHHKHNVNYMGENTYLVTFYTMWMSLLSGHHWRWGITSRDCSGLILTLVMTKQCNRKRVWPKILRCLSAVSSNPARPTCLFPLVSNFLHITELALTGSRKVNWTWK